MNTPALRYCVPLVAVLVAGAGQTVAHAQQAAAASRATPAAARSADTAAVAYLNGGIGKDEAGQITAQAGSYNLRLMFSEGRSNAFVSGVHLRIADQSGHPVWAWQDAGPLTNVKLPLGTYQVDCSFGHVQRHAKVVLKAGQSVDLYLHFPHDSGAS